MLFVLHEELVDRGPEHSYFVILVLGEGVLRRVLVNSSSNAEAQDQMIILSQLLNLNPLLCGGEKIYLSDMTQF